VNQTALNSGSFL